MDTSELNVLLTKIASQMKLCHCNIIAKKSNNTQMTSSISSFHDEKGFPKKVDLEGSINFKENSDEEFFHGSCPICNSDVSRQEREIIVTMQQVFYNFLQNAGINLNSVHSLGVLQDTVTPESIYYDVKCDLKYLKRNTKGETLLHTAARKKDFQSVKNMIRENVNPNTQDNAGWTPLHEAVFDDNYDITLELLTAGAVVNVPGFDFTTPLHAATHHNNLLIVQLLLKFGADPSARDISGRTPDYYAKDPEILALLNEYSGNYNAIELAKKFQRGVAPRPITIYLTSDCLISPDQKNYFEKELNFQFSDHLNKNVTHVIIEHNEKNVCEATFQVLNAILLGCAIVNKYWLQSCETNRKIMNFSDYEVNGTVNYPLSNGPRKARNCFMKMSPPLFTGCHIYLVKKLKSYAHMELMKNLISTSGAKLLNREPHPEHTSANYFLYHCSPGHSMENTSTIILYDEGIGEPTLKYKMKHIKTLPTTWFKDCVQTFSILEPS